MYKLYTQFQSISEGRLSPNTKQWTVPKSHERPPNLLAPDANLILGFDWDDIY